MSEHPEFISLAAAAARIGVSTKTIRRRIADGTLLGYRAAGTLIRVDAAEVDKLLRPIPSSKTA